MLTRLRVRAHQRRAAILSFLATMMGVPLLCGGGPFLVSYVYNNVRIAHLVDAFVAYPLPPQTTRVQTAEIAWYRPQNGGTCVVNVKRHLLTALPREEITAYYAHVFFAPVRNNPAREDNRVGVVVQ